MAALLQWGMLLRLALAASTAAPPPHPITDLRVEHMPSPVLGVDPERPPRLSWRLASDSAPAQRGAASTGYEIEAVRHEGATPSLAWQSGRVAASSATAALWGGAPLRAEALYSWRVRHFPSPSEPSPWSEPAFFLTAPNQSTWRAQSSWLNGSLGMLRRDFHLPQASVAHATLFASTIGFQELYLNGELLGDQRRYLYEPGQSAYYYRSLVTTINVTKQLRAQRGAGTLGAMLGNGPCSVLGKAQSLGSGSGSGSGVAPSCHDYGDVTMLCCKRGKMEAKAFRAILSVTLADGSVFRVTTSEGAGWQTATGPVVEDDLYMGEVYDARQERPGFFAHGYEGKGVVPATVIAPQPSGEGANVNPNALMSAQMMPDIAVTGSFEPVAVNRVAEGVAVYEFERYMSGRCTLSL